MSVPRARILDLMKARCQVFGTTFNPDGVRTGNKILRQRLKGPSIVSYYPRRLVTHQDFQKEFANLELTVNNEEEEDRLEHIQGLKSRGKGAPKKKNAPAAFKDKK
ncbi:mitochondrial ribosomal subunit S27-domain-containing protein [Apodospora peruviana]|uniref:Small ribosomal subunit protein mS33 n=1 Tax=Apodospora peruviana TaxID=516989 RepID=A0AAE0HYE2_9PEZI|nr:mitochondrial ribosomal subunit S27-domain-containing protein [Apodospora peruviana]